MLRKKLICLFDQSESADDDAEKLGELFTRDGAQLALGFEPRSGQGAGLVSLRKLHDGNGGGVGDGHREGAEAEAGR